MSNELSGITNKSIRDSIGDRAMTNGLMVIHGSNVENVLTSVAVKHTINGVYQTDFAIDSEIDLSALTVISAKDGAELASVVTIPAIAAGGDDVTKCYVLAAKGNEAFIVEPELSNASQAYNDHPLSCPSGYAPFGLIKVAHTPSSAAGVALFTLGTSDLTGITNRTSTFFNIIAVPPTVASIVKT